MANMVEQGNAGNMRVSIFILTVKNQLKRELNSIIYRINIIINGMVCSGEVDVGWNHSGIMKEQRNQI